MSAYEARIMPLMNRASETGDAAIHVTMDSLPPLTPHLADLEWAAIFLGEDPIPIDRRSTVGIAGAGTGTS